MHSNLITDCDKLYIKTYSTYLTILRAELILAFNDWTEWHEGESSSVKK